MTGSCVFALLRRSVSTMMLPTRNMRTAPLKRRFKNLENKIDLPLLYYWSNRPWSVWDRVEEVEIFLLVVTTVIRSEESDYGVVLLIAGGHVVLARS